jgi:hypothetical protein
MPAAHAASAADTCARGNRQAWNPIAADQPLPTHGTSLWMLRTLLAARRLPVQRHGLNHGALPHLLLTERQGCTLGGRV